MKVITWPFVQICWGVILVVVCIGVIALHAVLLLTGREDFTV